MRRAACRTEYETMSGLRIYDISEDPMGDLELIAGPDGDDFLLDMSAPVPAGFRFVGILEWRKIQAAEEEAKAAMLASIY